MLRHLFKLIWNKKGTHSLLIIEILASFLVLFGVLSLIVFNVRNFLQPIGFEYEQVWNVDLASNQDTVEVNRKLTTVMQRIRSYKEVETATRMSSNTPFSANQIGNSVTYNKVTAGGDFYYTDQDFNKVLDLPLLKGRWYRDGDRVAKFIPIVINKKMEDKLFLDETSLNKVIKIDDKSSYKVVGVVDNFKAKGEFMSDNPALFEMIAKDDGWNSNVLIKTKRGTDANFEAKLVKDIAMMLPGWGIEVSYLKESRLNRHNLTLVPVIIFLIISGFLLTNVALGLFGVLNLNISRRKNEIGLRRAMGATEGKVTIQFLGEIWVIATFSLIIGLLFAVQFPLMNVFDLDSEIYITSIFASIAVIYIIVTLCAWLPSKQASRIHPALALHEE
ncbi:ABC transporter permease [Dyadobacter fanqingshengii]|uniref:FtsX-like permease family protein n=1 Tax=Dyadobacter fanqingshengii TaxID=2906443 RepID=A0A9X1T885_9BACT|nr:FtsX-like permease family protein [Dyadobacter fanqingshengii]MCF0039920.1 FtsX-like permease family protein [Dyadobacter fanqingshengii]MCF2502570.1 FtsX-like permease family protein [Dyadobacter fanqingshengii]USJ38322.1 FtsX-like permease family protein [Dyadobacter fanqingshengii]